MHFSSERRFKLWDYNVSHQQLLLRSPASPEIQGNVDIVFWGVGYVSIPTFFDGVSLADSTADERDAIASVYGQELRFLLYRLGSKDRSYFVAAGGFKVLTNDLDIFNSTLFDFARERPEEWYGTVVARS